MNSNMRDSIPIFLFLHSTYNLFHECTFTFPMEIVENWHLRGNDYREDSIKFVCHLSWSSVSSETTTRNWS